MVDKTNKKVKVSVFIAEEKVRELKTRAIKEGKSLSAWITDLPEIPYTSERSDLIEELNKKMEELYHLLRESGGDVGVFLHQSINLYADNGSIINIIADVKKHIKRLSSKSQKRNEKT